MTLVCLPPEIPRTNIPTRDRDAHPGRLRFRIRATGELSSFSGCCRQRPLNLRPTQAAAATTPRIRHQSLSPPRRAVLFSKSDSRCLRRIVVCDMPGHKDYRRPRYLALRHRTRAAKRKKAPKSGAFSSSVRSSDALLNAHHQRLIVYSPNRGRSPFRTAISALFIRKLSTIATS